VSSSLFIEAATYKSDQNRIFFRKKWYESAHF
jgi:hypothetical protein